MGDDQYRLYYYVLGLKYPYSILVSPTLRIDALGEQIKDTIQGKYEGRTLANHDVELFKVSTSDNPITLPDEARRLISGWPGAEIELLTPASEISQHFQPQDVAGTSCTIHLLVSGLENIALISPSVSGGSIQEEPPSKRRRLETNSVNDSLRPAFLSLREDRDEYKFWKHWWRNEKDGKNIERPLYVNRPVERAKREGQCTEEEIDTTCNVFTTDNVLGFMPRSPILYRDEYSNCITALKTLRNDMASGPGRVMVWYWEILFPLRDARGAAPQ